VSFSNQIWQQLKNLTADDLCNALRKDGWECDTKGGSMHIYLKGMNRVSIHYHPKKTYGAKMLQGLLGDIGWSESDLRKLKLIK
jgi:predicted RNA binding protein YcfA (HicA-like mRNA interferase family)